MARVPIHASLLVAALGLPITTFVTRSGASLLDGGSGVPLRFGFCNAYWLGLDENENGIHNPTHYRIDDALTTLAG